MHLCLYLLLDILYIGGSVVDFSRTGKKNNNENERRIQETVELLSLFLLFHTVLLQMREKYWTTMSIDIWVFVKNSTLFNNDCNQITFRNYQKNIDKSRMQNISQYWSITPLIILEKLRKRSIWSWWYISIALNGDSIKKKYNYYFIDDLAWPRKWLITKTKMYKT